MIGQGSKRGIGRAAEWDLILDPSDLSGVTLDEPEELILSAKAGTPIAEIRHCRRQQSGAAFEPMDHGPVSGAAAVPIIMGALAAASPAAPHQGGAARDHSRV